MDQALFKANSIQLAAWPNLKCFEELTNVSYDERKQLALLS